MMQLYSFGHPLRQVSFLRLSFYIVYASFQLLALVSRICLNDCAYAIYQILFINSYLRKRPANLIASLSSLRIEEQSLSLTYLNKS